MNMKEVENLIKQGESQRLEFKTTFSDLKRVVEIVASFANTDGGVLIIGVSNGGSIKGLDVGKQTIERLINTITDNTDPTIYPKVSIHKLEGKKIILTEIDESINKPHLAFGRSFKRIGNVTKLMKRDEYERLLLRKERDKLQFDSQICKEVTVKDIDKGKVGWFLRKAKFERKLGIEPQIPPREALRKLNLLTNEGLTNAAILMFGKEPQKSFIQSEVRCARFKGTKAVKPFVDMKVLEGTVYEQIDQEEKFVLFNMRKSAWLESGKIERQEKWEYPPDAIREAITNAIAHRDYFPSANVQIRIFDDRIEIWNPGTLPEGLTIEKLKGKHESKPRNKLIANLFFLIKYIEQWGTGTNEIIDECIAHGLPEPLFEDTGSSFIVTFRKSKLTSEFLEGLGLNKRQEKAIEHLKGNKRITSKEYAKLFNITERTARNDIKTLINKNVIMRRGKGDKNTYYILAEI